MRLKQLIGMLELQNTMNEKVNPDWINAGYNWRRATWLEAAELVESTPWKWWKQGEMNVENIKTEVVDIWHFALSQCLIDSGWNASAARHVIDIDRASAVMLDAWRSSRGVAASDVAVAAEYLVHIALKSDARYPYGSVVQLVNSAGLSSDELYTRYLAKNVLNIFRQDYGYKAGTYIKQWGAGEDNDFVTGFLSSNPTPTPEELRSALEKRYLEVTRAAA